MPSEVKTGIDSPFVSFEKLLETIDVLKKLSQMRDNESVGKKPLLEDTVDSVVKLQINLKKIPLNKTTFIVAIPLPNHWRHESDYETCLIVKDINKTPLTDRDLDLDETKSHYKELLAKDSSDLLVTEVIPMRELRNEYKVFEAKQRLCKAFDVFLCDRKLLHNKFDYLSRFLGKTFWTDGKKVPIPVDLTSSSLKSDLESKLNQTQLYLTGKGDSNVVDIGLLKQSTEKLAQNLLAVNRKLTETFADNIRSLSIKTLKSISITFFMDCGLIRDIKLVKHRSDNTPFEGDFSHFTHSNVQIFKNGSVRVIPKSADDIDGDEEINPLERNWISRDKKRKRKRNKKMILSAHKMSNKKRKTVKKVDKKSE